MATSSTASRAINRNSFGLMNYANQADLALSGVSVRENSSTNFSVNPISEESITSPNKKEIFAPSPRVSIDCSADIDAAVIQLWEGRVLDVDPQNDVMNVLLTSKIGQIPEHSAEIELQWVSDQDRDLVVPGAIFYLTLFKKTRRGSIQNSQELRFRRRPAWTKQQVQKIYLDANQLLVKMHPRPIAA